MVKGNPPASGFNISGSDEKAIIIADEVMAAQGGRLHWDNARYFTWVFFGSRKHYWDKKTGNIRIESLKDSSIYLLNLNSMQGKVKIQDTVYVNEEAKDYLQKAKEYWINDMYWLFMPFKLKDTGVSLKYSGESNTRNGAKADVLQLTFEEVGVTPQNKYLVYVDKETRLVSQWDFFSEATQDSARFQLPWEDYKSYGNIKLASSRTPYKIEGIDVPEKMPETLFTDF